MLTYIALQYGFVWVLVTHLISLGLGVGFAYSVVMQAAASVRRSKLKLRIIEPGKLGTFINPPNFDFYKRNFYISKWSVF